MLMVEGGGGVDERMADVTSPVPQPLPWIFSEGEGREELGEDVGGYVVRACADYFGEDGCGFGGGLLGVKGISVCDIVKVVGG